MAHCDKVKPLLKWVGGKTQIINHVIELFPKRMNNYHEPFLGGGSVLLALLSCKNTGDINVSGKIYASDLNEHLISFYKNVQTSPEELIDQLHAIALEYNACPEGLTCPEDESLTPTKSKKPDINRKPQTIQHAQTCRESYYYWIRSKFNKLSKKQRTTVSASAMLLFMNKTCFRGVYREGPNGFNVPFGHYKQQFTVDAHNIREVSHLIKDVVLTCCPFETSFQMIKPGDFVYLDPPYAPENQTSFVSYNYGGFCTNDHVALFKLCNGLTSTGIPFLMSNADVDFVNTSFTHPTYTTIKISCKRAIHSKDPSSRTNEVLITNTNTNTH